MTLQKFSHFSSLQIGKRFQTECPPNGADALLLAQWVRFRKSPDNQTSNGSDASKHHITAIVTADASDARRLQQEINFFEPQLRVVLFPDWETLPYDTFSPHQDLISERLATLWQISQQETDVLLVPAKTALYRLAPPAFLAAYTFFFKTHQTLDAVKLKAQLTLAGYQHVNQVVSAGEYTVRGGLIDLFPMGSPLPYRMDLLGDEIDSIKTFDPDTQRSLYPVPEVRLLPAREFPMDDAGRLQFQKKWADLASQEGNIHKNYTKSRVYKDMQNGMATAGIEYYLPLFFEQTTTIFDYLPPPDQTTLVLHGDISEPFTHFWQDTQSRYRTLKTDPDHPSLQPELLFLTAEAFYLRANAFAQLSLQKNAAVKHPKNPKIKSNNSTQSLPNMAVVRGTEDPLLPFKRHITQAHADGYGVLIVAESSGRMESLLDFFRASQLQIPSFSGADEFQKHHNSTAKIGICQGDLSSGLRWLDGKIDFITETELFAIEGTTGTKRRKRQEQASDVTSLIKDLSELNIGDPVVHLAHGIGRYRGLVFLSLDANAPDVQQEFLHLEYADKATLYVPLGQLQYISRYTGVSPDQAPLHKLGGAQWDKAKRRAAEQIRDSAAELLDIYARRAAQQGHAFCYSPEDYATFAADFGFEETPDQQAAIQNVMLDMTSPQPMDRLVCGDVGFGKTEVALRAAFIAMMGGKQVALLAPTTLLAEQHYQTLQDRFAKWPIKIAEMSRFRSSKEIKIAMQGLENGSIDIVVGTHKLLSGDVKFARLGLLIIDEEHRFGVRHKETMKAMRAEIDVLTLTATPIPRTLSMALEGLRDLSVIATAPQRRLAIKTFVRSEGNGVIREAVLRELNRGGQVYFLHNEVDTIENRRERLEELLPEARIAIAHGQMPERQLEKVMKDFVAQRFNVLLCSTIIETGIDVPSANTIIMSRADKFGLAQLHQLRGRVGRSHHQAYAYLMVPDLETLSKHAAQRLEAIGKMEELGSGFYLAMHDLEIRGTGEVLGESQSGNMLEIGFQLYNDMLSEAVRSLKTGKEPDLMNPFSALHAQVDVNLHAPALLPNAYCGDVHLRLSFYKKFAMANTTLQIDHLLEELVDRFGKLPTGAQTLVDTHRLRILAKPYGVLKIDATAHLTVITFQPNPPIDALKIIQMVQKNKHIKLAGNDKIRIHLPMPEAKDRALLVRDVLRNLGDVVVNSNIAF